MSKSNSNKCTHGVIKTSYRFAMDGEFCSGYNEYNVLVQEWWGKSGNYLPKEVKTLDGTYYRETKKSGWRKYNKSDKTFYQNGYTGTTIQFLENGEENKNKVWNKVNLGDW